MHDSSLPLLISCNLRNTVFSVLSHVFLLCTPDACYRGRVLQDVQKKDQRPPYLVKPHRAALMCTADFCSTDMVL